MSVTANKPQYITPLGGNVQWGAAYTGVEPESFPQQVPPIKMAMVWLNSNGQRCEGMVSILTPGNSDALSLINWDNVITFVPTL